MLASADVSRAADKFVTTTAELETAVAQANAGDVIHVAGGNYTPASSLDITVNLTVVGPTNAPAARIVGSNVTRTDPPDIFRVEPGVTATIANVALTTTANVGAAVSVMGTATLEGMQVSGNNGIAVWSQVGAVTTIRNSTISDNADAGVAADGVVSAFNSTITNNTLSGFANGSGGTVNLTNTIVFNNGAGDCVVPAT